MCSDATDQEKSMVRAIQWLPSETEGVAGTRITLRDAAGTHLQGEYPPLDAPQPTSRIMS